MNKALIISILTLCLVLDGRAQGGRTGEEDTLKTRIVTVFDYKPTVSDAKKLGSDPLVIDTNLEKPEAKYVFENMQYNTVYMPDTISAAKMKGEPLDPLYRAHIKGGLGNGVNYLFDGYVNSLRSRDGELGLALHGKGTQGVLTDLPPANYNRWVGNLHGKRFLKKHELSGKLGFDRERIQHYGYSYNDTLISPLYLEYQGNEDAFKQVYSRLQAEIGLKSFFTDSAKLNHDLGLFYLNFSDINNANKEHNLIFDAHVQRFFGNHLGSLDFTADFNSVNYVQPFYYQGFDTVAEQNTNVIIGLTPKITSQAKKWRLEIGVKPQLNLNPANTEVRIYPDIYAKYNLVKEVIIPYGGITGGLVRNNLSSLTEINPFLWTALTPLQNTDRAYHVFGGFRGVLSKRITYNLFAGQHLERGTPLFVNYNASTLNPGSTPFGLNYFVVEYDTLTTFELGGEITYRIDDKLHMVASGKYMKFQTRKEAEPWHRPNLELNASLFYHIQHKIIFKAEMHILGAQKIKGYKAFTPNDAESVDTESINGELYTVVSSTLKPIVDASIGAEYRYTERLSGFLNVNNLLIQRYQRWNQYPVQRFNVLAGITYSFWKE